MSEGLVSSQKTAIGGVREPTGKRTFVSLDDGPGRYTVTPAPGSAKIVQAAASRKGYDSDFDARITGSGDQRTLTYDVGPRGGDQSVTFYEKGQDVNRVIATVKSGKGEIDFTPAEGAAGKRTIVAVATLDGVPIPDQVLASFKAAAEAQVRPPTDVEVQRRAGGLVVTWEKAQGDQAIGNAICLSINVGCRVGFPTIPAVHVFGMTTRQLFQKVPYRWAIAYGCRQHCLIDLGE